LTAQQTGVFELLQQLWPNRAPDPPPPLLLAGRHSSHLPARSKTEVADWYDRTVLQPLWALRRNGLPPKPSGIASRLCPEQPPQGPATNWSRRSCACSALWKQKQLVSRRLLGYDTTNFYTYIASTNTQNHLAQRGHNKQAGTTCAKWVSATSWMASMA